MRKRIALGLLTTCFCGLLIACGALGNKDAVDFNNSIANANKKLEQGGKDFGSHLSGAINGNQAEVAAMKKEYENLKALVASTKTEIQGLKVPSKQSAKDYQAAELKFLDGQEKLVGDLGEIVRIVEDRGMNALAKQSKTQPIMERIAQDEKKDLGPLQAAQAAFAKDYNIIIIK
jgi:hypothetical protein